MRYLTLITCALLLFKVSVRAQVDFRIQGSLCVGNQLVFIDESSLPGTDWLWDFGNGDTAITADSAQYMYKVAGSYTVKLTLTSGVDYSYSYDIDIHDNPSSDFLVDTLYWSSYTRVFTDNSVSINAISKYIWDFGDGVIVSRDSSSAEYKYQDEGDYEVTHTIIDEFGCIDSSNQDINVTSLFSAPNVFSPNDDLVNDNFVVTVNGVDRFSIDIYSRWGNLVFRHEGVNQIVWDGRLPDGTKVTPGTYYYVITSDETQKAFKPHTGFVMVFYDKYGRD